MAIAQSRYPKFLRPTLLAPDFDIPDIQGNRIRLSDLRGKKVLLSFFRDAGCPFCNLRVYELSTEYEKLRAQGMEVIAFFRSNEDDVRRFVARRPRPFTLIADPKMAVYSPYGIEHSWFALFKAMMLRMPRMLRAMTLAPPTLLGADPALVPADFLIDQRGFVRKAYYGRDMGDHLPMEEIRAFAARP